MIVMFIKTSTNIVNSWSLDICCDCDALENLTKTTCTNTTKVVPVANPVTNLGTIIGAAGGGMVFGSVVTVLLSKVEEPAKQREQSSSRKDVDNQFIGLNKENKSGK
uniref:Uncharacterized protein n=1 Tax=Magallana gigas TaxID=29159 RepID=K1Q6Y8_MAGGI